MAESATEVKLFGKWSLDDVEIADISLVVSPEITKNKRCSWCSIVWSSSGVYVVERLLV